MKRVGIGLVVVCVIVFLAWTLWQNQHIRTMSYTIQRDDIPTNFNGYVIAQISDFHNTNLDKNDEQLMARLKEASPDIIVITGDLVDSRRTDIARSLEMVKKVVTIAPVYYVSGNHESRFTQEQLDELMVGLEKLGVIVLNHDLVEITNKNQTIQLAGIQDPRFVVDDEFLRFAATEKEIEEIPLQEDTFTILLAHRPDVMEVYVDKNINLVLTGHAHGGQVKLPFIGPLYAPQQGFFPKYVEGVYHEGNTDMVVSRGIGESILPLRINDQPELVVVTLQTK